MNYKTIPKVLASLYQRGWSTVAPCVWIKKEVQVLVTQAPEYQRPMGWANRPEYYSSVLIIYVYIYLFVYLFVSLT